MRIVRDTGRRGGEAKVERPLAVRHTFASSCFDLRVRQRPGRLGSLWGALSVRGHVLASMPPAWYWSTPTSRSQEFGGLQPRDERSRYPSLGLPRVGGEPDRGRPALFGPVNWCMVAQTSGTFFSIQAGCTSKPLSDSAAGACSSFSSRATQSVTCDGLDMFLPIVRAQSRARRQARLPDMPLQHTPAARRPA
jgi:hypothetical protein